MGSVETIRMDVPRFVWQEPEILQTEMASVLRFDENLLPVAIRNWIIDISERMDGAPLDYAAVSVVVALGSLIGRKVAIHPKQNDDWIEFPMMWGGLVGRPSAKKSPICNTVLAPIRLLESQAQKDFESHMIDFGINQEVEKLAVKEAETKARQALKKNDKGLATAIMAECHEQSMEEPTRKRYLVNDTTMEKLGEILRDNPCGVLLFRDELMGWLKSLDREDRGHERAFYLEAWNGKGGFTFDRIGRGTINLDAVAVSILGGIQPGKLLPYLHSQRAGYGDDGLLQRFQLLVYPDQKRFKYVDRLPDQDAQHRAQAVFQSVADIHTFDEPIALRFNLVGQEVFENWYCYLAKRIREESDPHIEAHLGKYPSLVARLALIFHVCEFGTEGDINEQCATQAIGWCTYLESHARRIYGLAVDDFRGARSLADKFKVLPNPFAKKDFNNKGWSALGNAEEINHALNILIEKGYIQTHTEQTQGKPKTLFYVNPNAVI